MNKNNLIKIKYKENVGNNYVPRMIINEKPSLKKDALPLEM